MNRWLALAALGGLVLLTAGCGGSSPYLSTAPDATQDPLVEDTRQAAALGQDLHGLDDALVVELNEVAVESNPDTAERCEEACNLCFNICDLRERICTIADDHPDNGVLSDQCVDASVRCKRGTRDTDAVCDCSEVEVRVRI